MSREDEAIVECAKARREAYKRVNLFRAMPGEIALLQTAASDGSNLVGVALQRLKKLEEKRRNLVSLLPQDEDCSDSAVRDRLILFLEHEEFYTLDLVHGEQDDGPHRVSGQIRRVLSEYNEGESSFRCDFTNILSEAVTGIHISFPDLEAHDENDPRLYVTSNSLLATVKSANGSVSGQIALRSEYVMSLLDLKDMSDLVRSIIMSLRRANALPSWRRIEESEKGGGTTAVARARGELFAQLFAMIENGHDAIHHLYTGCYIARQENSTPIGSQTTNSSSLSSEGVIR